MQLFDPDSAGVIATVLFVFGIRFGACDDDGVKDPLLLGSCLDLSSSGCAEQVDVIFRNASSTTQKHKFARVLVPPSELVREGLGTGL